MAGEDDWHCWAEDMLFKLKLDRLDTRGGENDTKGQEKGGCKAPFRL